MLIAGGLSGGMGTAVAETADVSLAYGCEFPSGAQQVTVRVTALLPTEGTTGQAVSPAEPTVTVTVPRTALGDLTRLGAATVGATEKLTVNVTQPGASTVTAWRDLSAAQTALPSDGDLVLEASGVAEAVRPAASGRAVFAAGGLAVDLVPRTADGTATSPSMISLNCAPTLGYDTTIATVAISDDALNPPGTGRPDATGHVAVQATSGDDPCPVPQPTGGLNPKFPPPPLPPEVTNPRFIPDTNASTNGCGIVEGLSNVKKLEGATPLGGITAILQLGSTSDDAANFARFEDIGFSQLEPRRATLLTFGFVPVSATLEITQLENMNLFVPTVFRKAVPPAPVTVIAQGEVSLRLTDAHVNGVPLDIGPNCRSAEPVELTLHGTDASDPPYRVTGGGKLTGEITIPPFSGCGVGEDLDPLFTASVSGPGNLVQVVQGPLCFRSQPDNFVQPCPAVAFGFTVDPGGQWTATAPDGFDVRTVLTTPPQGISCESAVMKGSLRSGVGVNPSPIGEITDLSLGNCAGTSPPLNGSFTVTPVDLPWKISVDSVDPAGTVTGHFQGEKLHFSTQGCSFDASDPGASAFDGALDFTYTKPTFSIIPNRRINISNVEGCTSGIIFRSVSQLNFTSLNVTLNPQQMITQP